MTRQPARKPNWSVLAALAFCATLWALAADGGYRVTHDNGHGLRFAVQAKALKAVHRLRRWAA